MRFLLFQFLLFIVLLLPTKSFAQSLSEVFDFGLPVVVISTNDGVLPKADLADAPDGCWGASIANATKVPGSIKIYTSSIEKPSYESGEYIDKESGMTIKLRGNTSARGKKKAYKIKLQKKEDLLMRGDKKYKDKNWALIHPEATSTYPSPINTLIGNKVNEIMQIGTWTPACQYVNLFINDSFCGLYILTESIERNTDCRIDVDKATGYIAEVDPYWWNEDVSVESEIYKLNTSPFKFTFKYPDSDDITSDQLNGFKQFIDVVDSSVKDGNYEDYIDLDSWARWFLGHQILGTKDYAGSNCYMIRYDEKSKLAMGPMWDFDTIEQQDGKNAPIKNQHYFKQFFSVSPSKALARKVNEIWESEKARIFDSINTYIDSISNCDFMEAMDCSIIADINRWNTKYDDMRTTIQKNMTWFESRRVFLDEIIPKMDLTDSFSTGIISTQREDNTKDNGIFINEHGQILIKNYDSYYSVHGIRINIKKD